MGCEAHGTGRESRPPRRAGRIALALLLGGATALQFVPQSPADGTTIEAGEGATGFFWRPSTASVGAGGTLTFSNPSTTVPHGVSWTDGPGKPSCTAPVEGEKADWSGSCTFGQPGTYDFVCTVHGTEMKGTITVTSGEAPPPPPPGGAPESPLSGSASSALKLAKSQRGRTVRGSVALSPASAGGRLEVVLLAKQASLSSVAQAPTTSVGRLVRSHLTAGRLSFAVPLERAARRALRSNDRLPLTVRLVLTPPGRAPLTLTRGVVLHG